MAWWDPLADTYCRNCKRSAEVVLDHAEGDAICSECGLVLLSHSVDESSGSDPSSVADPISPVVPDSPVATTLVALGPGAGGLLVPGKWKPRGGSALAFKRIAYMVDRLGLATSVKDRANEIYKKVEGHKSLKGRNQGAVAAACLYIACRQENKPCTVKEIASVADMATKREIGRAKQFVLKHLEVEAGRSVEMGTIHAADYLRRFCSNLGMTNEAVKATHEVVQKSKELDIRRSPTSVAATVIYIVTQLSADDKRTLHDITVATQVTELTIKNTCKDMYPHLKQIVPTWFASEEEISNLVL